MTKRFLLSLAVAAVVIDALPQEVGEYGFLELPVSAHSAALGGTAISIVEPDASLADQNPALLCPQMDGQVMMSYMNYVSDINLGYAGYTRSLNEHGAWQASVRYVSYGEFDGYDEYGNHTGSFGAKDVALQFGVGYPISDNWRAGVSARAVISSYDTYSAFALGVDAGLNYYDETVGRSISMVVSNLGGQLKSLDGRRCQMPTQLSLAVSKEVEHLPFCFTMTACRLLDWDSEYYNGKGEISKYSGGEQILTHLLLGAEWIASDNFYVAAAYSYRRQREFSGQGGFLRGLSMGAGINFGQWRANVSYASYNTVEGSLMFDVGYRF
ncbi:MAG: type IX secretion system protein PorQ [Bacteroidales bacterium]|nr:type IX secretion system protein PorQ [Candidatus Liminaster caballi]